MAGGISNIPKINTSIHWKLAHGIQKSVCGRRMPRMHPGIFDLQNCGTNPKSQRSLYSVDAVGLVLSGLSRKAQTQAYVHAGPSHPRNKLTRNMRIKSCFRRTFAAMVGKKNAANIASNGMPNKITKITIPSTFSTRRTQSHRVC